MSFFGNRDFADALRTLIESSPADVAIFNTKMEYLWCSEAWLSHFNLKGQEIICKSHYEIFPNLPENWKEAHRRALSGETLTGEDHYYIDPSGNEHWINWKIMPWFTESRSIGGVIIFSEDMTSKKKSQLALKKSEQQLLALNLELENRLIEQNRELDDEDHALRTDYRPPGSLLQQILHGLQRSIVDKKPLRRRVAFAGAIIAIRFLIAWKAFPIFGYLSSLTVLASLATVIFSGPAIGFMATVFMSVLADYFFIEPIRLVLDTGYSKQHFIVLVSFNLALGLIVLLIQNLFRRAVIARREALRANRSKSSFLANMSHEIRTPLGAVVGFAKLIAESDGPKTEHRHYLEIINRNAEILSKIIDDVLDISKVEAGKIDIHPRPVTLNDILASLRLMMEPKANDKGIKLKIVLDNGLPGIISTDPARLSQILFNLVGNAIKFTAQGHVMVLVSEVEADNGSNICFDVSDTGMGIDKDRIARLFNSFSQVHSTLTENYGGTGLGLALSKRLAQLLGGDIFIRDTVLEVGSTFRLMINPRLPSSEGSRFTHQDCPLNVESLQGLKILVADDNLDNQELIEALLVKVGAKVDFADNGHMAYKKIQSGDYNVVLMDLQMPLMGGYEVTEKLRKENYRGKIIAFTAHAFSQEKQRCLDIGFDAFLSKPINHNEMMHTLASI